MGRELRAGSAVPGASHRPPVPGTQSEVTLWDFRPRVGGHVATWLAGKLASLGMH